MGKRMKKYRIRKVQTCFITLFYAEYKSWIPYLWRSCFREYDGFAISYFDYEKALDAIEKHKQGRTETIQYLD